MLLLVSAVAVAAGCGSHSGGSAKPSDEPAAERKVPTVTVIRPQRRTLRHEVGQPGTIEAFEETPIVAKVAGYIEAWKVDIGDRVRKGQVLAELYVPELVAELEQKKAQVEQARKALLMAQAQVDTARARVREAEAARGRAEADRNYWQSQRERFTRLVGSQVIDKQTQEEAVNKYRSAAAALKEAQARIESARATEKEKAAARDKARADIQAAEADRLRVAALVGYTRIAAPFDGVVTRRHKNTSTGRFVQPATSTSADVLYVVERTDVVRIFIRVPEAEAPWVDVGSPASVRVPALHDRSFTGKVTRTAWSLNHQTRTLRAEIDLPNPHGPVRPGLFLPLTYSTLAEMFLPSHRGPLRPGLYVYGTVTGEHRDVLTVPTSAVATVGDVNTGYKSFCHVVVDGKVKRTPVEIGARNGELVELLRKQGKAGWEPFSGEEELVQGELARLQDGQAVVVKTGK